MILYCKKVYLLRSMPVCIGLIMVSCLVLSFLLITSGVYLFIDKSGLACCLYCTKSSRRCICCVLCSPSIGVRFPQSAMQPMGRKGRYLKKSTKSCWTIRSKETWVKGTQDWDFFWLRFWNLYYFFINYVKILRFYKKIVLIRPLLGEIRFYRLVWD